MTDEQIDRITKKFWEYKLKDTTIKNGTAEHDWYGLFDSNDEILVGCALGAEEDNSTWFYDGSTFNSGIGIFGINRNEFVDALKRYLKKTYGFKIRELF
jgi:hypothetical protein